MKHLLLTGDDFGRSSEVNAAIEKYHSAGALTQASLMVNESGIEEAVRIARRNPGLCVGLHLTLCDGRAARISSLTDHYGILSPTPAHAGVSYAFLQEQQAALTGEIERQFSAFHALGFEPTYWDGHHHLHLHPTVLRFTLPIAQRYGFRAVRLVREPFSLQPLSWVFRLLSRTAAPQLEKYGIYFVDRVYGLSRTGQISEKYVRRLLPRISEGWSELYFHPGAERLPPTPSAFAEMLHSSGIQLTESRAMLASRTAATGSTPAHSPVSGGAA